MIPSIIRRLKTATRIAIRAASTAPDLSSFGILEISDQQQRNQQLYFGGVLTPHYADAAFAMPPRSPAGFDARYNDDTWLTAEESGLISFKSNQYPITLDLKNAPGINQDHVFIQLIDNYGLQDPQRLNVNTPLLISDTAIQGLRISTTAPAPLEIPEQFNLQGNYPNPFNPTTTVVFDLPESARVNVDVYDMLGRLVMATAPQEFAAGTGHQVSLEATNLASGMYIYHIKAQTATDTMIRTGRMTFLK